MPSTRHVQFATYTAVPGLFPDDALVADALRALGVGVTALPWDAPWPADVPRDAVVLRSTWDYFERIDAFRAWLDALDAAGVPAINDTATVRRNLDKTYLRDLAATGLSVVETAWPAPGGRLADVLAEHGWTDAVVKPSISGGAYETRRLTSAVTDADEAWFAALRERVDVLVQPFREDVVTRGEVSLLYFGGAFSHAVVKRARPGEYRIQFKFGGTATPIEAPERLVGAGRDVLAAVGGLETAYARVDGLVRADGGLDLMEVELIEPVLYLESVPEAAARAARAIADRL